MSLIHQAIAKKKREEKIEKVQRSEEIESCHLFQSIAMQQIRE